MLELIRKYFLFKCNDFDFQNYSEIINNQE